MRPSKYSHRRLLVAVLAVWIGLAGCTSSSQERPRLEPRAGGTNYLFEDTFDGSELDPAKWVTCYWWARSGCTNLGTGEDQWYQKENVSVRNGKLRLTARRDTVRRDGATYRFTSGMVTTGRWRDNTDQEPRFATQYGRIEARMRMPRGRGFWPAFWLLPVTHESRPETDIIEVLGRTPRQHRFHIHVLDEDGERVDEGHTWRGVDTRRWHRYAVQWTSTSITWLVDDVVRWEVTDPSLIAHEPQYLLLNLAVGGEWAGPPSARTRFPATMLVDWVRVSELPEQPSP